MNRKLQRTCVYLKYEYLLYYILNVTFDQLNVSLLNKSITESKLLWILVYIVKDVCKYMRKIYLKSFPYVWLVLNVILNLEYILSPNSLIEFCKKKKKRFLSFQMWLCKNSERHHKQIQNRQLFGSNEVISGPWGSLRV